jgi:hypothetical protein
VNAKYLNHYNGFIHIAIGKNQYLIYIGHLAKLKLAKLAQNQHFSAICEIYYISSGNYPDISEVPLEITSILSSNPDSIWLNAKTIKTTTNKLAATGYFALQDKDKIQYGLLNKSHCLIHTHTSTKANIEKPRIIPPELQKFFPSTK